MKAARDNGCVVARTRYLREKDFELFDKRWRDRRLQVLFQIRDVAEAGGLKAEKGLLAQPSTPTEFGLGSIFTGNRLRRAEPGQ